MSSSSEAPGALALLAAGVLGVEPVAPPDWAFLAATIMAPKVETEERVETAGPRAEVAAAPVETAWPSTP